MASFQTAVQLDPRDTGNAADLGFALMYLRRYPAAKTALDRARVLNPGDLTYVEWRVMASLGEGDLAGARQVLHSVPATVDPTSLVAAIAPERRQEWILDDAQRQRLLTLRPSDFDDDRPTWALTFAEAYATLGDARRSRAYADTAVLRTMRCLKMPAMRERTAAWVSPRRTPARGGGDRGRTRRGLAAALA